MSDKIDRFRFIRTVAKNDRAAGGVEYAIILGLIALVAIGGITLSGQHVRKMYELGGNATNTTINHIDKQQPFVSLSASPAIAHPNDSVDINWSTTFATEIAASATYSGTCAHGASTENLDWSAMSGSVSIPWTQSLAGCAVTVHLEASNGTYTGSKSASATFAAAVTTPANLAFDDKSGVDPNIVTTSNTATVTGIELPATVTVEGGQVSVNGGSWTTSAAAPDGATVQLQTSSPEAFSAQKTVQFLAGTATGTWNVATRARDIDPDQYSFAATPQATPGEIVTSQTQDTLSGFDGPLTVFATNGGLISKDGTNFVTSGNLEVNPGDLLWVRLTASATADGTGANDTTISIGGTSADFAVSTLDLSPNTFAFQTTAKAEPSALVVSQTTAPLSGFDGALTATATNNAKLSTDGINFTPSVSVTSGQNLWVQLAASADTTGAGLAASTVSIGSTSAVFTVETRDEMPNAFAFLSVPKTDPGQTVASETTAALDGFDGALTASATNGAQLSTDGVTFTPTVSVAAGQSLWVQLTASTVTDGSGTASTTVTIGRTSANFTVQTRNLQPGILSFDDAVGLELNTAIQSNVETVSDIDGSLPITVSHGLMSINGGSGVSSANVSAGDTVRLLATSAATYATTLSPAPTIQLGSNTPVTWTVTTRAQDTAPNSFAFTTKPKANPGDIVTSQTVAQLTGFDGPVTASATNGAMVSTDGVNFAATTPVNPGQYVWVRLAASSTSDGTGIATTTVSAGTTNANFSVQTNDLVPDAWSLGNTGPLASGTWATSPIAAFTGFDGSATIAFSSSNAANASVNVFRASSGTWTGAVSLQTLTISSGDKIQLGLTTPAGSSATGNITATLTTPAANMPRTWTVTALDTTPNAFTLPGQSGVATSTAVNSSAVTVTGFDGPLTATCGAGCTAIARNGVWGGTSVAGFMPNDTIAIRLTSSASNSTTVTASVTLGLTTGTFSVTTVAGSGGTGCHGGGGGGSCGGK